MANNFYKSIDEAFDRFEVRNKGMIYQNVANSVWIPVRPRTQTSLFWWKCARKGRREGDNGRDGASPAVCTLPMVPCGSSPVTRFVLASAMRKTKRLRRRLIPVHVTVVLFKYNIIIYYNLLICFSQIYVKKNILKIPPHVLLPEDKVKNDYYLSG